MSRPISESLSLLSETLDNCKTNLKEKEVADVDNIKISDVDEKIAEVKSGGGDYHFDNETFIKVEYKDQSKNDSSYKQVSFGEKKNDNIASGIDIKVTLTSEMKDQTLVLTSDTQTSFDKYGFSDNQKVSETTVTFTNVPIASGMQGNYYFLSFQRAYMDTTDKVFYFCLYDMYM